MRFCLSVVGAAALGVLACTQSVAGSDAAAQPASEAGTRAASGLVGGDGVPAGPDSANASQSKAGVFTIRLEQQRDGKAAPVAPSHVFEAQDVLRFRVTAQGFQGYLYVIDLGTSGTYSTLYPAAGPDLGAKAQMIQADQDVLVPAVEDGWFQVDGPPGFDVLYFLVSPHPLDVAPAPSGKKGGGPAPESLQPRCNDAIFQARGECLDDRAGPAAAGRDIQLPAQITAAAGDASRDLVFQEDEEDHAVKAAAPLDKPMVYVFKLAHH